MGLSKLLPIYYYTLTLDPRNVLPSLIPLKATGRVTISMAFLHGFFYLNWI